AAIVKLGDRNSLPAGVHVVTQFGDIATVRLRRDLIPHVSESPEVAGMVAGFSYLGADVETETTTAVPELSADEVLPTDDRRPNHLSATGKNVVVGVVDWGFDFTHPDFRNPDGSTRILALWDQRGGKRPDSPEPFGYGVVHTQAAINQALKAKDPFAALHYHP